MASNKKTMHKTLTDEEYEEHVAAGYPIDENDLQDSYYQKLKGARSASGAPRRGQKTVGQRANPVLEREEGPDRASRTTSGIAKAFGGKQEGPSLEERFNQGVSGAISGAKKFINKAIYGDVPEPSRKKKREEE